MPPCSKGIKSNVFFNELSKDYLMRLPCNYADAATSFIALKKLNKIKDDKIRFTMRISDAPRFVCHYDDKTFKIVKGIEDRLDDFQKKYPTMVVADLKNLSQ